MCTNSAYKKDEPKVKLRDKILVYGAVPRSNIRPTDLGPVILPRAGGRGICAGSGRARQN